MDILIWLVLVVGMGIVAIALLSSRDPGSMFLGVFVSLFVLGFLAKSFS